MDLINLMNSLTVTEPEVDKESNLHIFAAEIEGVHTDIVFGIFTNIYLIIATQYEKAGTLLTVSVEQVQNGSDATQPIHNVYNLFGNESFEQCAAARHIAQELKLRKPLKIFLSLKDYECRTVKALIEALLNIPQEEKETDH